MKLHFVHTDIRALTIYKAILMSADSAQDMVFVCSNVIDHAPACDTLVNLSNACMVYGSHSDLQYSQIVPEHRATMYAAVAKVAASGLLPRVKPGYMPVGSAIRQTMCTVHGNHISFVLVPILEAPEQTLRSQSMYHAFKMLLELMATTPSQHHHVLVPLPREQKDIMRHALHIRRALEDQSDTWVFNRSKVHNVTLNPCVTSFHKEQQEKSTCLL